MTTTLALGARADMSLNRVLRLPGSWLLAWASALLIAFTQELSEPSTQVSITLEKPTSLPPMTTDTRLVELLRAEIWLLITSLVVAPEQATNENDAGACAFAQSRAAAFALRSQEPP